MRCRVYSAEVGGAVLDNKPWDLAQAKHQAASIATLGKQLTPLVPAGWKRDLAIEVQAMAESARYFNAGGPKIKVIDPIYNKTTRSASDRLNTHDTTGPCQT